MPPDADPLVGLASYWATVRAPIPLPLAEMAGVLGVEPERLAAAVPVVVDDDAPCWRVAPVTTGGVGAVGVTGVDAVDAVEVPVALVAVTVKVYAVPGVRLLTVQLSGPLIQAQVLAPGELVTV